MDGFESNEPAESEPFLLFPSSQAFLHGDRAAIRERFQFRRDGLDYIAMALILAGGLLLAVRVVQLLQGGGRGDEMEATVASIALAALLILGGGYYVASRHSTAAARARLVDAGQLLAGAIVTCTARHETTAEAAFGEKTRTYLIAVDYTFTPPFGHEITNRDEHNRPDLRQVELPEEGTAVRVLYLDDQTYALL